MLACQPDQLMNADLIWQEHARDGLAESSGLKHASGCGDAGLQQETNLDCIGLWRKGPSKVVELYMDVESNRCQQLLDPAALNEHWFLNDTKVRPVALFQIPYCIRQQGLQVLKYRRIQ